VQPEGKGQNLVVLIIIAVTTFLLPIIQRWLRLRAERAGTRPRELEGEPEGFDPFREPRPDEPEARGSQPATSLEEAIADKLEAAKLVPKDSTPAEVKPLLPPRAPLPNSPVSSLEERLFANRRWSAGARLILAREVLARPRCFRRST
jgi:hypothetical protein